MESKVYIFHREDMFYPLLLSNDKDAVENAKCNDGTVYVEDINGRVIWTKEMTNENIH